MFFCNSPFTSYSYDDIYIYSIQYGTYYLHNIDVSLFNVPCGTGFTHAVNLRKNQATVTGLLVCNAGHEGEGFDIWQLRKVIAKDNFICD